MKFSDDHYFPTVIIFRRSLFSEEVTRQGGILQEGTLQKGTLQEGTLREGCTLLEGTLLEGTLLESYHTRAQQHVC